MWKRSDGVLNEQLDWSLPYTQIKLILSLLVYCLRIQSHNMSLLKILGPSINVGQGLHSTKQFNSLLTQPTWGSVRSYGLRAQSYKTASLPSFRHRSWASDWPVIELRFPTTPFSELINLLEQLTKLKGTFYLLDPWFTIKGCNLGTARWKRC